MAVQLLMRGIVEPAAHPGGVGKWEVKHAILFAIRADNFLQARLAEKGLDCHGADEEHNFRAQDTQLGVEIGSAERHLRGRGFAITVATHVFAWITTCQRTEVCMFMQIARWKARALQPRLQDAPTRSTERSILCNRAMAGSLADNQDAIIYVPAHDWVRNGDIAVFLAKTACADTLL